MRVQPHRKKIAVVGARSSVDSPGGAERFSKSLAQALERHGAFAKIIDGVIDESSVSSILTSYSRFYHMNLSRFDGVISIKSPAHMIRHSNHVCYLQHTMRQFYDRFLDSHPASTPQQDRLRDLVLALDRITLRPPWITRLFVIGRTVQDRLGHFSGLESEVLYQGLSLPGLHNGRQDYLFLPGRLHRWKRVNLAIDAMGNAETSLDLLISGLGSDEPHLRRLAKDDKRIKFIGYPADDELVHIYADALAVLFVPKSEDFGLVTLEAFLAGKPVITCEDSGEPAVIVEDGLSGLVCKPDPREIAAAIDFLSGDRTRAEQMGQHGRSSLHQFDWDNSARVLLDALALA